MLPTIPGMAAAMGLGAPVSPLLTAMYDASWLFGTTIAGCVYMLFMGGAAPVVDKGPKLGPGSVPPWPA